MSHVSRHPHALEYARRKRRRADRTCDLEHRTVRFRTTAEMMPFYNALKALAFADSNDVDELFSIENLNQDPIANLHRTVAVGRTCCVHFKRNLTKELHRREVVLGEVSALRLREARLLYEFDKSDLRRLVSILHSGLMLRHHARAGLKYCDRANVALRVKQLRHPAFLAQKSRDLRCHFLLHPQRGSWLLAGELTCS